MTCRTWHPAEAQLRTSNNPMLRACRKPCRTWHPAEAQLHSCRPDQPPSAACRTWCKTSGQRPCPRRIQSTAQLSSVPVSRSPYRTWPSHPCRTWCRAPSLSASAQGQQRQDWTGSPDRLVPGGAPFSSKNGRPQKQKRARSNRGAKRVCCVGANSHLDAAVWLRLRIRHHSKLRSSGGHYWKRAGAMGFCPGLHVRPKSRGRGAEKYGS